MADTIAQARAFRAAAALRDQEVLAYLTRRYTLAYEVVMWHAERMTEQIAAAQLAGTPISPAWLYQQERYRTIQAQLQRELIRFADDATEHVTEGQLASMEAAVNDATALGRSALPPELASEWTSINLANVEQIAGQVADGTPLSQVFRSLPVEASERARQVLVEGVALGKNPRVVAQALRKVMGSTLSKALTIARTEMLRAYRETSKATYQENDDILEGWQWHSARTTRTCAVCWAMHGQTFPTDQSLESHPNCRCSMVPITKSYRELGVRGVRDPRPRVPSGESEFKKLTAQQQRAILGPSKYDAYKRGEITLGDLVQVKRDPQWGTTRTERSLRSARGRPPSRRSA